MKYIGIGQVGARLDYFPGFKFLKTSSALKYKHVLFFMCVIKLKQNTKVHVLLSPFFKDPVNKNSSHHFYKKEPPP